MPNAAALGDATSCPVGGAGVISTCACPSVLVESRPAARLSDLATCPMGSEPVVLGEVTVLVGGMPQARLGDPTGHGGAIVSGAGTVLVGDGGGGGSGGASPGAPASGPEAEPGASWDELVASEPDAETAWASAARQDGVPICADGGAPRDDFVGFAALLQEASRRGILAAQALYRAFPHRFRAFDLWFPNGLRPRPLAEQGEGGATEP